MNIVGFDGLIKDLEFSFFLPCVVFVLALINIRLTPRSKHNGVKLRIVLLFLLIVFACTFSSLMVQDRKVLESIWRTSPKLYSGLYALFISVTGAIIVGITKWKLLPGKWKNGSDG